MSKELKELNQISANHRLPEVADKLPEMAEVIPTTFVAMGAEAPTTRLVVLSARIREELVRICVVLYGTNFQRERSY